MASGRLEVLGAPVDPLTLEATVRAVEAMIDTGDRGQHASVNAAKIVRLQNDAGLREVIQGCELVTADGQSVVWAARLLGQAVPERVAGVDLMHALLELAGKRGYRVYLLGARPEVLDDAVTEIRERYPAVVIVGHHHGYFGQEEEPAVVGDIAATAPDLLFIALETPQKELFLGRHRDVLRVPFAMGVGGAFDILAGRRKRAPRWVQRAGLEWLFRFLQEPRRLARRYVFGNARFVGLVVQELARARRGIRTTVKS